MAGEIEMKCPVPCYQDPQELAWLIERVRALKPHKKILEVGSLYGGTLWHWMDAFTGATVVSVDLIADNSEHPAGKVIEARKLWQSWADQLYCCLTWYVGPSTDPLIVDRASEHAPYDFIFVDAGHKFEEVKADFETYWPMLREGGLMAFHDIAYPDSDRSIGVGKWWRGLVASGTWQTEEICRLGTTWGIGVIRK